MTINMDQLPSTGFSERLASSSLIVGPHTIFTRRGLVLNDRSSLESYWVNEPTGFETPDISAGATANVQEDYELPDPASYGGRTMTLSGWIQAGNYTTAMNMARALLDSLVGLEEEPLLISSAGGLFTQPTVSISCRLIDRPTIPLQPQASWFTSGLLRVPFSFSLRASTDASFKSVAVHSASLVPEFTSSLGRVYPRTYPLTYDTPIDSSGYPVTTGTANTIIITNAGNWRAYPTLTFYGMLDGARLVNAANGHEAIIVGTINAGNYIKINTRTGKVVDSTGASAAARFDTSSDWLALMSGPNALSLVVNAFDPSGRVDISWQDTTV